jgi:flagellar biosynthetic protein FliQ
MTGAAILDIARDGIVTFLKVGAPLMLIALAIGLVISLLQALTQIQEQTLIFVPKILAVFAAMLVPYLFTTLSDLVSISQARRAAGFLPFAFAFAGGMGVLARLVGPLLLPLALGAGMFLQIVYPGDFDYVLREPAPAWIAWFAVLGALAALVVGIGRRRPALETGASLAAAAFLIPVYAGGLTDWNRPGPPELATLNPGVIAAVRSEVESGAIVWADTETSFRIAAFAPVYIAAAPPGHVADTEDNRPYERASDARRFFRTGDLAIPRGYGADVVVVDALRSELELDLPVLYSDERFTVYRL